MTLADLLFVHSSFCSSLKSFLLKRYLLSLFLQSCSSKPSDKLYDPRAEAVALPPKEEPKIGVAEDVREEAPPQVASTSGNEQELVEEVNKGEGKDQTGAKPGN